MTRTKRRRSGRSRDLFAELTACRKRRYAFEHARARDIFDIIDAAPTEAVKSALLKSLFLERVKPTTDAPIDASMPQRRYVAISERVEGSLHSAFRDTFAANSTPEEFVGALWALVIGKKDVRQIRLMLILKFLAMHPVYVQLPTAVHDALIQNHDAVERTIADALKDRRDSIRALGAILTREAMGKTAPCNVALAVHEFLEGETDKKKRLVVISTILGEAMKPSTHVVLVRRDALRP